MSVTMHHGDCLDVLSTLAEASIDAVVCDPPYEMKFMSRAWDGTGIAFRPETWAEVLRVMRPGAHLVAFGGTRTYHRMVCAIEDAGFEVRDQLAWIYGSGFPKSHDIGKAIDKMGHNPEARRAFGSAYAAAVAASGLNHTEIDRRLGVLSSSCYWARDDHRAGLPPRHHFEQLRDLLGLPPEMAGLYEAAEREIVAERRKLQSYGSGVNDVYGGGPEKGGVQLITAPATPEAARWAGWGTALKPSHEPIVLARKPLACPTVAAQVLATGTGALNVDGCRVGIDGGEREIIDSRSGADDGKRGAIYHDGVGKRPDGERFKSHAAGRWPANLVHSGDEQVLEAFAAFGERATHGGGDRRSTCRAVYGAHNEGGPPRVSGPDTGSAARFFPALGFGEDELRFFYSAKASKADRCGSVHPTIKPLALMRWLCRLVTPPGGTVLDCFAGTGVTGEAALLEGFGAVLIEREAEHVADIRRRLGRASGADTPLLSETAA